ncbi:MAG: lysophospholipase [Clostridia bacterium]|nr:lysophospholipase [Clostridia bacterium]
MLDLKKSYKIKSTSALSDINIMCFCPAGEIKPKGIVQIAHGMAEHLERYDEFISILTANGFAVFINDHLGHGKSVAHNNELGFFGEKDGYKFLVKDMKLVTDLAKKEYPGLPVILFGHSMGSFLARYYTELYGDEIKLAIYCGTAGSNPAAPAGAFVADLIAKLRGSHYRSKFINNLAFGSYNKKIENKRTDFDWLTTDNGIVDEYIKDKYCGFLFTATGYRDLFNLLSVVNRKEWFTSFNKDLPLMLIAGEEDPVGSYGKGVYQVYDGLVSTGHTDVKVKFYKGDRHEILNEKDRLTVMNDIVEFINENI